MMDSDRDLILSGIQEWVEHESHTADVDGVNRIMSLVETQYRETGAHVERIAGQKGFGDCLSIRSQWGGDGPYILVLSHLDTVHPKGTLADFPFQVDGDRAFGPGTYDMKGGAYLGYESFRQIVATGEETPLPIRVLYVSDEEVGSLSSRPLIEAAADGAKYVLVTEPARHGGKVVTGRKGTARYQVHAHGRPAHSGSQHPDGRSAIREIARQVLRLEELTDYDREITLNVGQIQGGTSDNTIPERCTARVDLRVATLDDFKALDGIIRGLTPSDPDVKLTIEGRLNRPPYRKTPDIQALFEHAEGLARTIGFVLEDTATGGGSDGSFAAERVPTLDGLGVCGANAHTLEEYLEISSLMPRLALLNQLMRTLQ